VTLEIEATRPARMSSSDPSDLPRIPRHVAIIMDGNGRWARQRSWNRVRGHREGIESVRDVVKAARTAGVEYLTLYAFSAENWGRPPFEVRTLMTMLRSFLRKEVSELKGEGVKVRAVGDLERLPPEVLETLAWAEQETGGCSALQLILALSYGARAEILQAARTLLREGVDPDDLDEDAFRRRMYAPDVPDPDLLIRTSGEMRVSNFLLWQIAYTEIFVTDVLWPDFRAPEFRFALEDYAGRERRFGLTAEQVQQRVAP
jgi:undecaprenyl diphosphate synthase